MVEKTAYICGPLTELSSNIVEDIKRFYEQIADVFKRLTNLRAFVPHEHCDPKEHAHLTPEEVDEIERNRIYNQTSVLVVVALFPSWGGGIEVEMANRSEVPVVIICERGRKVSRLLRGNPAVKMIIEYNNHSEAIKLLEDYVIRLLH